MNIMIMLLAALLPAVLLLLYIWKKDTRKEPTIWLLKAVGWGVGIILPVIVVEMLIKIAVYHFVDHSPKIAVCVLLVPILAHGTYNAIAMTRIVSPVKGELGFLVLIYFCIKMHKLAKSRVLKLIKIDSQ